MDKLETGYILMPKEIIECESLNLGQKVLLSKVYGFTNSGTKCYLSNKMVGKLIGVSTENASRYINSLIKLGLMERYEDDFSAFHTVDNLFSVLIGLEKKLPYKQKLVEIDKPKQNVPLVENDNPPCRNQQENLSKTTRKLVEIDNHKEKEIKTFYKDFKNTNTGIIEQHVSLDYDKWLDSILNPLSTPPVPEYFGTWITGNPRTWKQIKDHYQDVEVAKDKILDFFNYHRVS